MRDEDKRRSAARRRKLQRRRQLRLIYSMIALIIFLLVVILAAGLFQTRKNRSSEIRAAKAAEIEAEETAIKNRRATIAEAEEIAQTYDYDGAISLLQNQEEYDTDPELINAIARFTAEKSSLEAKDPLTVPHIFYHSLIVDTDRAFNTAMWGE